MSLVFRKFCRVSLNLNQTKSRFMSNYVLKMPQIMEAKVKENKKEINNFIFIFIGRYN